MKEFRANFFFWFFNQKDLYFELCLENKAVVLKLYVINGQTYLLVSNLTVNTFRFY